MVFRKLTELLHGADQSDSFESRMPLPLLLLSLLLLPFRLLFQFGVFMVTYWASSRSMPAFVKGIPAMAAAAAFVAAMIFASFLLERNRIGTYQSRFSYQMTNDNAEMAAIYADKLMGFLPEQDRYRFNLGIARFEANDKVGAMDVMKFIADKGYPQAQVWLAKTTIRDESMDLTHQERVDQAIHYYNSAIVNLDQEKDVVSFTDAHLGLAEAYEAQSLLAETQPAKDNSLKKAIEKLDIVVRGKIIVPRQLEAIPRLIRYYHETGQVVKAREQLRLAMKNVGPIARSRPDNLNIWGILVTSCVLVDDFDYAEEIIEEGFQLASTPETKNNISRLHSEVLIRKADFIEDLSVEANYRVRLAVISQAVAADPFNLAGYERLIEFASPDEDNPQHEVWLRRSLIGCRSPGIIHIVLGLRAFDRGDILEGKRHWVIASQQTLQAYRIINFLIDYAHTKTPEKFDNLQDIVSVAIESFPNQFIFYITRGKMHLAEGKNQLAVNDFEVAARKFPNSIVLRESLSQAYSKLGNTEKAEENQQIADELKVEIEKRKMEVLQGQQ